MHDETTFVWVHRFLDVVLPLALLVVITYFLGVEWHDRYLIMGFLGGSLFSVFAQRVGLYRDWRGRPFLSSINLISNAWILTWMILIVLAFLAKDVENFSRFTTMTWALVSPVALIGYRLIIRIILSQTRLSTYSNKRVIIIGVGKLGRDLERAINKNKWLGYEVVAFIDDDPNLLYKNINNIPVIGNSSEVTSLVNLHKFNEVYIALPLRSERKIKKLLNDLTDTSAIVKIVPDLFTFDLMNTKLIEIQGIPIVSVYDTPLSSITSQFIKRAEDLIISIIIVVLVSPVMLVLALGVKCSSPGPMFYKQSRIGWNGKKFDMLKFRSMPIDVEKNGIKWGKEEEKINTKFGEFIRRFGLDELPQFFNVIKGDMSIIGPRPERDIFVKKFRKEIPRYMQKHMVKAGISGWAQVHGWRGDTSLEKRIEFDLHYINSWSLWLDFKIIFMTIIKVFDTK